MMYSAFTTRGRRAGVGRRKSTPDASQKATTSTREGREKGVEALGITKTSTAPPDAPWWLANSRPCSDQAAAALLTTMSCVPPGGQADVTTQSTRAPTAWAPTSGWQTVCPSTSTRKVCRSAVPLPRRAMSANGGFSRATLPRPSIDSRTSPFVAGTMPVTTFERTLENSSKPRVASTNASAVARASASGTRLASVMLGRSRNWRKNCNTRRYSRGLRLQGAAPDNRGCVLRVSRSRPDNRVP